MNPPTLTTAGSQLDQHFEQSQLAQRQADKWLISGSILIGTAALGIFGLPLFLRGVWLQRKAQRDGLNRIRFDLVQIGGQSFGALNGQAEQTQKADIPASTKKLIVENKSGAVKVAFDQRATR